ncbi:hypothetical protein GGR52DRAFT_593135 [Hypoxylon sp. FL1284]|nr:hypothetical protein GGR52DRAFT_593135 [Hypoxylon sp. FL1284]
MLRSSLNLLSLLLATAAALPTGNLDGGAAAAAGELETRAQCATKAEHVQDAHDTNGRGVQLKNADTATRDFFVFANGCDSVPLKYVTIPAGQTKFVALPAGFQGRIVRGTTKVMLDGQPHTLATWLELGMDSGANAAGWADVSLIRGCDGPVTVSAMDGSGASKGFKDTSVLDNAPPKALQAKASGAKVIKATELTENGPNGKPKVVPASRDYLGGKLGYKAAYIDDYHGNPVIKSANQRFNVVFYKGRP